MINGLLLGDGCLEKGKNSKNACLRITRAIRDKEYLYWNASVLKDFLTEKGVYTSSYFDNRTKKEYFKIYLRSRCSIFFTDFYSQWYVNKKKIIPSNLILNKDIVKVWFADDGSVIAPKDNLNKRRFSIKFATHSFSKKEVMFLKQQLDDLFCVNFHIYKEKNLPQYTLRLERTNESRAFLIGINDDFPLARKSAIWRNSEYGLFVPIMPLPFCRFCNGDNIQKNGWKTGEQYYRCLMCGRQFSIRTNGNRKKNKNGKYNLKGKYWKEK